jgi:hypothetical protein
MSGSPAHESSSPLSPLSPGRHPIPSMYMWGTEGTPVSSPASVSVVSTSRQCLPPSVIVRQCPSASAKRPDRGRRDIRVYKREMYNSTRGIVNSKWKEPTRRGKKGNRSRKGGKRPGRSAQSLLVNRGWRRGSLQSTVFFPRMLCRGPSIRIRALG